MVNLRRSNRVVLLWTNWLKVRIVLCNVKGCRTCGWRQQGWVLVNSEKEHSVRLLERAGWCGAMSLCWTPLVGRPLARRQRAEASHEIRWPPNPAVRVCVHVENVSGNPKGIGKQVFSLEKRMGRQKTAESWRVIRVPSPCWDAVQNHSSECAGEFSPYASDCYVCAMACRRPPPPQQLVTQS